MRDDPRFSHCRRYPSRFNRATNCLQCGPVAGTITMPKSAWHFIWPCLRASPDARHPCAKMKKPCPIGKHSLPLEAIRPMASAKSWTSALALTSHCTYQFCFQQHSTRSAQHPEGAFGSAIATHILPNRGDMGNVGDFHFQSLIYALGNIQPPGDVPATIPGMQDQKGQSPEPIMALHSASAGFDAARDLPK